MRKVAKPKNEEKPRDRRRDQIDQPIPYALTPLGESAADPHGDRLGWDEET
jgi:hypothetical protein